MHKLDLRTDLPRIRQAFENKELQAQRQSQGVGGKYAGPCAVGVLLEPSLRRKLDQGSGGGYSIGNVLANGAHLSAPADQHQDWLELQRAHDGWLSGRHSEWIFKSTLADLEAKYLEPRPANPA